MMRPTAQHGAIAVLAALACAGATAQEIRRATPPAVPALPAPAEGSAPAAPVAPATGALEPERIVLPALRGLVLVPDASPASVGRVASGLDLADVPWADDRFVRAYLQGLVGEPLSMEGIQRVADGLARLLRARGQRFVTVWVPPQDLTAGVLRIAARRSTADGPVTVQGAREFGDDTYLRWIRQQPGEPVDAAALAEDVAWINRHPFRQAVLTAEPGSTPGTTRLGLQVREQDTLRGFVGMDNSGTATTGTLRSFAGFQWGNAFGRGDQLSYQLRTDPDRRHALTHSASYLADLPWRHALALTGAWSRTEPDLGPNFTQHGRSWQLGARYLVPRAWQRRGWVAEYALGLDYKFADNNLEFSATPVAGNETRIVQAVAGLTLVNDAGAAGTTSIAFTTLLSPGGSGRRNDDAAFDGSRAGARARYAIGRIDLQHRQPVGRSLQWDSTLNVQLSSGPLLGSEQITAGGNASLRGYPESAAFGDRGVVFTNELRVVGLASPQAALQWSPFVFGDTARIESRGPGASGVSLASLGLGLDLQWGRQLNLRLAVGWPLHDIGTRVFDSPRAHLRLLLSF